MRGAMCGLCLILAFFFFFFPNYVNNRILINRILINRAPTYAQICLENCKRLTFKIDIINQTTDEAMDGQTLISLVCLKYKVIHPKIMVTI